MRHTPAGALAVWLVLGSLAHSPMAHADDGPKPAAKNVATARAEAEPAPSESEPVTDETAFTLDAGSLRLGLFKFEYSILDFLTVGTYTLPWGVLAPTVTGKLRLLQAGPLAVALQAGFAYFDSSYLLVFDRSPGDALVTVFPLAAFASYRFSEALALTAGAAYTEVAVDGELTLDVLDGAATGVSDNFQLTAAAQIRFSRGFALLLNGRWLVLQRVSGKARATLHPDAFTTVVVNSDLESPTFQVGEAFSILPSLLFSLGAINLRLGFGYGNYNVALVNFVIPRRTPIPEFDLYFVF